MKIISLFLVLTCACGSLLSAHEGADSASTIERRAVIDVGSGGTKVAIADVEVTSQTIREIVFEESFPVPYQAALASS